MQIKDLNELGINPRVIQALEEKEFTSLTDIQNKLIPSLLYNKDVLAEAPTGSGKTFAFAIPLINDIEPNVDQLQALIITPTRELALQVGEEIQGLLKYVEGIKVATVFGGTNMNRQILALKKRPNIIVGTPGRILDHVKRGTIKLHHIKRLVLDECDVMLDMGFIKDIEQITNEITSKHVTALLSATISKEIKEQSKKFLKENRVYVQVKRDDIKPISQFVVMTQDDQKFENLQQMLVCLTYKSMFIFVRTKKRAKNLTAKLEKHGYCATCLHGDMSQKEREVSLKAFRNKQIPILVATDVASRGIDVSNVEIVINYDIPEQDEYYLHRIGRVGRASCVGEAYTLMSQKQKHMIKVYEAMSEDVIHPFVFKERKDLKKMELTKILEGAKKYLNDDLTVYSDLIKNELELWSSVAEQEVSIESLCCALLKQIHEMPDAAQEKEKKEARRENRGEKPTFAKIENAQRFFINIGNVDGLSEQGLFDFLATFVTGITMEDFSDMYLCGTYSFFEIRDDYKDAVLNGVEGNLFNGREVRIEVSEKRRDSGRSSGGRGGDRGGRGFGGNRGGFGGGRGGDRGGFGGNRGGFGGNRGGDRGGFGGNRGGFGGGRGGDRGGRGFGGDRGGRSFDDRGSRGGDRGGYNRGSRY